MRPDKQTLGNMIGFPPAEWAARLNRSSSDILKIASELLGSEFLAEPDRQAQGLQPIAWDSAKARIAAEWAAYDRLKLFAASVYLLFGTLDLADVSSVNPDVGVSATAPIRTVDTSDPDDDGPSLAQVLEVARKRDQVRNALLAYASGGAAGLFESYEALSYEIMDCVAGIGTKEWLVGQGWITEEEDDRFLRTVLHYHRDDRRAVPFDPFSPFQAQLFVRKVLTNFLRYCTSPAEIRRCGSQESSGAVS
jgi:hypothetical protein